MWRTGRRPRSTGCSASCARPPGRGDRELRVRRRAHRPRHPGAGRPVLDLGHNDPLDRQSIQRWTSLLVPPEYLGGHLGDRDAHITGRTTDLAFRQITALFGSAGIEWNLLHATDSERDAIAAWITLHKRLRGLLHTGRVVRADTADPAQLVHGVVAQDLRSAIFAYVTLETPQAALPSPVRFPGLDPERVYTVTPLLTGPVTQDAPPPWVTAGR